MSKLDEIFKLTWKIKSSSYRRPVFLTPDQEILFNEMVANGCLTKEEAALQDAVANGTISYDINERLIDDLYRFK